MKNLIPGLILSASLALPAVGLALEVPSAEASGAASSAIPYKKEESGAGRAASNSLTILVAFVGVGYLGLLLAKRYFPKLPLNLKLPLPMVANRRLKVVETMRLGPKSALYLVQLDARTLLLAQSGDRVTLITEDTAGQSERDGDRGIANDV